MKMKKMKKMKRVQAMAHEKSQTGFTIIELVVVILLLGILTATALPRFLDLSTEAHDAVVDGVEGSLRTGAALFRAQYVASGSPGGGTQLVDFGNVRSNVFGYPGGEGDDDGAVSGSGSPDGTFDLTDADSAHQSCVAIYVGLMQGGAPTIVAAADDNVAAFDQTADIDPVVTAGTADFIAKLTAANTCTYLYVGDTARTTLADSNVPALVYEATPDNAGLSPEAGAVTATVLAAP